MTDISHTPGPWYIHPELQGAHIDASVYRTFYSVEIPACAGGGIALVDSKIPANARLIKTAPDLLAHLTMLVDGIAAGRAIPPDGAAVNAAREVIAEAMGVVL